MDGLPTAKQCLSQRGWTSHKKAGPLTERQFFHRVAVQGNLQRSYSLLQNLVGSIQGCYVLLYLGLGPLISLALTVMQVLKTLSKSQM